MAGDLLSGQLQNIPNILAAIGGLGTASFGLVDASKALWGGVSNAGFNSIKTAVTSLIETGPSTAAGAHGSRTFGSTDVVLTLQANWVNGVAKQDQKAIAKSLIRLGITVGAVPKLAARTGVDPVELGAIARSISVGEPLTLQQVSVLGRFDAIVSAILDEGYERGDQEYRNMSKLLAAVFALTLAVVAGGLIYFGADAQLPFSSYLRSRELLLALLIGAIATPLAPIVKDLSSSLAAAVKAVGSVKR